jgi:subtilisin family serine protease
MDAAVGDGADIINMSLGSLALELVPLFSTPLAIASQNAAAAGVSVVVSAGNQGPQSSTLDDWAQPWLTTVAASTHNRQVTADVRLGNNSTYAGIPSAAFWLYRPILASAVILAETAVITGAAAAGARRCLSDTLDPAKASAELSQGFATANASFCQMLGKGTNMQAH